MALLTIRTFPDKVLLEPCEPVTTFDGNLRRLADDMIETMLEAPGAGLAAPQVGVLRRMFVANGEYFDHPGTGFAVVNPRLVSSTGKTVAEEGCLSLPGLYGNVKRSLAITVEGQNIEGNFVTYELDEWPARIFLHEMDHLDGVLFPERMTGLSKQMMLKKLKKLVNRT